MSEGESAKTCFVIGPIGDEESPERKHSNKVLRTLIKPVVDEYGYRIVTSNEIPKPGSITPEIINHLIDDDLVIADLTTHNPNVFYELGIRHAAHKPFIHMIMEEQPIPFDIADMRTIFITFDAEIIKVRRRELKEQIEHLEENPEDFFTPISDTLLHKRLSEGDELMKSNARIISMLEDIRSMIAEKTKPESLDITDRLSIEVPEAVKNYAKMVAQSKAFNDLATQFKKYAGGHIPANKKPTGLEHLNDIDKGEKE